jgi:hypothetical protein
MKTLSSAGDLQSIRSRIALVSPTDARLWGSMSAHQMLCHLTDAFCCPLGERLAPPVKGPPIPIPVYKWLALYFPRKWPHGVPTPAVMDQQIGGTAPGDFAADRKALLTRMDQFARSAGPWSPHPMFGAMTTVEWKHWGYLHTDHHLRQFGR